MTETFWQPKATRAPTRRPVISDVTDEQEMIQMQAWGEGIPVRVDDPLREPPHLR